MIIQLSEEADGDLQQNVLMNCEGYNVCITFYDQNYVEQMIKHVSNNALTVGEPDNDDHDWHIPWGDIAHINIY